MIKNNNNTAETKKMKTAKELIKGDKLKAGETVCEVENVKVITINNQGATNHEITIKGQPPIMAWNLQKYIDQGSIVIL